MKIPKSKSLATKTRSTDFSHKKWRAVKKKKHTQKLSSKHCEEVTVEDTFKREYVEYKCGLITILPE
jgi:hypothetical protein